jgi:hypothetical protein
MRGFKSVLWPAVGFLCVIMLGCAGKPPANGPGALNIAEFTLQVGAVNVPYMQLLIASGGQTPYTWSITSGSLPAGLNLTSDGVISGTPSGNPSQYSSAGCALTSGSFPITCNFAAQVVDSQTPIHAVDSMGLSITINQDLSLTSSSLNNGITGEAYTATISAANGVPPYTYNVASGSLPAGVTLSTIMSMNNMANGASISGIPTTAGVYTFTVQATDSISETATAEFTITVTGRLQGPYAITFNGFDSTQPAGSQAFYLVGELTASNDMNGMGQINGFVDQAGPGAAIANDIPVTGTYNIPAGTNFGTINFTRSDNNVNYQFNVVLSGNTADSNLIQVGPTTQWGSGLLKVQSASSLQGGTSYAFGEFGTDASGGRYAGAGAFALTSQLAITGGAEDTNDNGTVAGEQCITGGSFTTPDSSGRGTATLMVAPLSGGACGTPASATYAYYLASSTELIAVSTGTGAPLTLVDIQQQQTVGASGGLILCKSGSMCQSAVEVNGAAASGSSTVPEVELGVASFDGMGNFTRSDNLPPYYVDQSVGGTYNQVMYSGGTYSIDSTCGPQFQSPCGRVTINLTGLTNQPVWYLYSGGQGFVLGTDTDVLQGALQTQSAPSGGFTLPSLLGSYLGGTITPSLSSITNELDVAGTPPPGGNWLQNYETSGPNGSQTGLSLMGIYNLDPTYGAGFGRFAICAPNTTQYCTSFTFDPNNPPVEVVYIVGGGTVGATGGKSGLEGMNFGVPQSNGTATLDPNPRLSTYGK